MHESRPHIGKNRNYWDEASGDYQRQHGAALLAEPLAWGVWRISEAEINVLGDLNGLNVLEFGCGGAQWAAALAQRGVSVIGMDLSSGQLAHARRLVAQTGVNLPLVQASAENVAFRDGAFDVIFCDHGAMSFADPYRTVPEAARLLRPGGLLAFCMSSPFLDICYDPTSDVAAQRLYLPYFGLHRLEDAFHVTFQLSYGDWIRLFRHHGLMVEDLIELRPKADATTTYAWYAPREWARRWPAEQIWKVRRE
jgi:ubiquinone/menaquinone biosynthesis C-methylase UbiE